MGRDVEVSFMNDLWEFMLFHTQWEWIHANEQHFDFQNFSNSTNTLNAILNKWKYVVLKYL